jgi:hypothetical protein
VAPYLQQLSNNEFLILLGVSRLGYHRLLNLYTSYLLRLRRRTSFSPDDELILILLFIRHYPVDVLLAFMMRFTKRQAQAIRVRVLQWAYPELHPLLSLQTAAFRRSNGATIFGRHFTFIFDGTEQRVFSSKDVVLDTRFFSGKKGQSSITIQVTISIDGTFLHLSPSFPGSVHDREIAIISRANWYDYFEDDEWGLGDNGYDGLEDADWRVLTPPRQLNAIYKLIAHYRIRVEQKIEELKNYRVCKEQLRTPYTLDPEGLLTFHNQMYTIVAVLINEFR